MTEEMAKKEGNGEVRQAVGQLAFSSRERKS